jgi:hypothetical protein
MIISILLQNGRRAHCPTAHSQNHIPLLHFWIGTNIGNYDNEIRLSEVNLAKINDRPPFYCNCISAAKFGFHVPGPFFAINR